jgi:hypothetical protein
MRVVTLALILSLCAACPAAAAPTCLTYTGDTIRCGAHGAMPVGWKPSAQQLWDREISKPAEQNLEMLAKVVCGLVLFLAMIALMPKFDGTKPEDWDRQEEDEEKKR